MKEEEIFAKADNGKPTYELLPFELLADVNKVLEHGKNKYGLLNWQRKESFKYSRCYNALLRHMFAWWRGQDLDNDTNISHLAHAMCNLLFLMWHDKNNPESDDRPKENI